MGRVLIDHLDTKQEFLVYMAKMTDKVDRFDKTIFPLAKRLTNLSFISLDEDSDPPPPIQVDSPSS